MKLVKAKKRIDRDFIAIISFDYVCTCVEKTARYFANTFQHRRYHIQSDDRSKRGNDRAPQTRSDRFIGNSRLITIRHLHNILLLPPNSFIHCWELFTFDRIAWTERSTRLNVNSEAFAENSFSSRTVRGREIFEYTYRMGRTLMHRVSRVSFSRQTARAYSEGQRKKKMLHEVCELSLLYYRDVIRNKCLVFYWVSVFQSFVFFARAVS